MWWVVEVKATLIDYSFSIHAEPSPLFLLSPAV